MLSCSDSRVPPELVFDVSLGDIFVIGTTYSSGTINKTLVLEPVGDDLKIVAVSEGNAE